MQSQITHLTDEDHGLLAEPGVTVVDFWAGWCGPCRAMAPQFERAAALRPTHRFAEVDVDAAPGLAARYGIRSIPTIIIFRDGVPVAGQPGALSAEQLVGALDRLSESGVPWARSKQAA